jgi:hypothetical protein
MSDETSEGFLAVLRRSANDEPPTLTTLCRRTLELLPVSGASVVLMSRGQDQGLTGASDTTASAVQNLEFTLGEGPGIDAHAGGRPVFVDDLQAVDGRWPHFTSSAIGLGVRAVSALPLHVGAVNLGVLLLYRDQPGAMASGCLNSALVIADLLTDLVLSLQSETASESLAWALDVSDYRAVVHQATGMISAQLSCGVEEALVRLRGHAFGAGRLISEVAEDVVAGLLRFDVA